MLSQFVTEHRLRVLGDLDFDFPEGIHAIGRLDKNSEGLLLLTTNKKVTRLLFSSKVPHERTYLVLVSGHVTPEGLHRLQTGVTIIIEGGQEYVTTPVSAEIVEKPANLFEGSYGPVRAWPHTFLKITLTEGKFHQVRKMVVAIGHHCRRLIRLSIEDMKLDDLQPGEVREHEEEEFFRLLKIDNWQ